MYRFSVSPSHSLVTANESKLDFKMKELETVTEKISPQNSVPTSTSPVSTNTIHYKPISITPDSIQAIPPFRPRKSKEWAQPDVVSFFSFFGSVRIYLALL